MDETVLEQCTEMPHPDVLEFEKGLDKKIRGRGRRPKGQKTVLQAIVRGLSVGNAAKAAGYSYAAVMEWAKNDKVFKKLYAEARELTVPQLEDTLARCARHAEFDPRFQSSLFFLLKSRKRDVYGDQLTQTMVQDQPILRVELTDGPGEGPGVPQEPSAAQEAKTPVEALVAPGVEAQPPGSPVEPEAGQ